MAAADLGSPVRALARLLVYGGFTVPLMPVQAVAVILNLPLQKSLPQWYHRRCARILGLHIESRGEQSKRHPTLYAANHVSYFDIMVLGALIRGSFVAKAEVAQWPLFGWLAKLQRSVFIERRGRLAARHRDEMGSRLARGDDLILFAEGTSGDGNHVLPFKSALFSAAERYAGPQPLTVQPVSIAYTRLDGAPMGRYLRPFFAWYGDMELAGHMWRALGFGWATVEVEFHPPVTLDQLGTRKALTDYCYERVAAGVGAALAGRPPAPVPAQAAEAGPGVPVGTERAMAVPETKGAEEAVTRE